METKRIDGININTNLGYGHVNNRQDILREEFAERHPLFCGIIRLFAHCCRKAHNAKDPSSAAHVPATALNTRTGVVEQK